MSYVTAATVWIVSGIALSSLMLIGYALFDIGSVRRKNSTGTIVRHVVVTFVSILGFLFIGFGLFFGGHGGFFGVLDFFTLGNYGPDLPEGVSLSLFVASQAVICAAVSNIVCGTLAERSNIASQVAVSLVVSLLIYPFVNRWTWGGGWLAQLGFHDFAGSASINVVAGVVALVASILMGPRADKYGEDGAIQALPGQSLVLCFMGSMLILAGWFGLVCVSSLAYGAADIDALGGALLGMLVSASVSTLTASFVSQLRYGSIDVPITLNGLVGGLVAVSSGADVISPFLCGIVGLASGLVVVFGIEWVERSLKVDDPVGTVVTHGFCGLLGLLLTGLFASGEGLAFGGLTLMGVQLLGALAIGVWACALTYLVLSGVRRSFDLRVFDAEERGGLGLSGPSLNNAYAEYLPASTLGRLGTDKRHRVPDLPIDVAVPLVLLGGAMDCKLQKIQIICRPAYLDTLREKMREIGVTGMTILEVRGCGEQKGARETYRGIPVNVEFVPKIQVDIVVSKIPVDVVVMAARRALYTGHIGDGKIFIYGVAEAVKVRTGEHGYDAVQNIDEKSAELS